MKEPHKRFLVFGIYHQDGGCGGGGFDDFIDSFLTLEEAVMLTQDPHYDEYQIYDREKGIIIQD